MDVVDPDFFQVIRLPLVEGNPATVFAQPESVVLSQTTARKYFGDTPAMGKTITITGQVCDSDRQNCETRERPLVVTGIMRDLPHNTQLQADLLIPNTSAADPMSQDDKKRLGVVQWLGLCPACARRRPGRCRHEAQDHHRPFA